MRNSSISTLKNTEQVFYYFIEFLAIWDLLKDAIQFLKKFCPQIRSV